MSINGYRHWRGVAVAAALAFAVALLPGQRPALAQEGQKVAQIVVTGNQNINRDTILNVIKLSPGAQYTKDAVDKDRTAINALGFFSAVAVRTEETPEGLRVIYDVVENPVVKSIEVVGSGPIPKEKVLELMRTRPDQVLNMSALQVDIDAIQRHYADQGYIAYITEDIDINKETGVLTIPILVHTVQSVDIIGNKKTHEYVFLREMKTRPGAVYNKNALVQDLARIWNLDVLEGYETPKIEPGAEIGQVSVAVPVTEKKTGQVAVGLGYSSRSKLVGRAELSETNFRGRGQGLTLLWETGAYSDALGGANSYEIGFHEPWIDKKHTSLSLNVFNKVLFRFSSTFLGGDGEIDGETYSERRKGGTVGLSRPLTDFTRAYLTLRGETVETPDIPLTGVNRFVAMDGPIRSGAIRLANNTRDFDRDPADGWFRSISVELGTADVSERFTTVDSEGTPTVGARALDGGFRKVQFDVRRYWSPQGRKTTPTDKRNVIAVRLLGGVASGELPFFEQYFVGGSENLRGYREDRFWGDKMLVASAEYRRPIAQSLTGVLFVDIGDAWGTRSNFDLPGLPQHTGFESNFGTGIGLRVNTPIGNLRLDYGVGSEGARTHFSIGHAF